MAPDFSGSPRNSLVVANVAATGVYFGVLQWGAFLLLQSSLAATAMVYLLATAAWMVGSLAGLALPGRSIESLWLAASAIAYVVLFQTAQAHPFEMSWLPVLLVCVACMGAYAGRFFRFRAGAAGFSRRLLLIENTGFVAGMLGLVGLLVWLGDIALRVAPALAVVACAITGLPWWLHPDQPPEAAAPENPEVASTPGALAHPRGCEDRKVRQKAFRGLPKLTFPRWFTRHPRRPGESGPSRGGTRPRSRLD